MHLDLTTLYADVWPVLGGLGTGIVYVGIVGLMVRWFPETCAVLPPALSSRPATALVRS